MTSKIEGVLSGMKNCTSISSVSNKGSGQVTLEFRKGTDMAAARFEVASRIRNMYASLPEEVSYPDISLDTRGTGGSTAISYVLKSSLPSMEIEKFVSERLLTPLSSIDGVDKVAFWGATPFELEVEFDSRLASAAGVTALEIADAFNSYFNTEMLGMVRSGDGLINLKLRNMTSSDLGSIPVKSSTLDGLDSLLSMVQMPKGIPVACVAVDGADNAAILAAQMLALSDETLADKLTAFKADMASQVEAKDKKIQMEEF